MHKYAFFFIKMLACYLVKFQRYNASEAIRNVRVARPNSIETVAQEETVHEYYKKLYENNL